MIKYREWPGWRNRQTRRSQKPVLFKGYRFDSDPRHNETLLIPGMGEMRKNEMVE